MPKRATPSNRPVIGGVIPNRAKLPTLAHRARSALYPQYNLKPHMRTIPILYRVLFSFWPRLSICQSLHLCPILPLIHAAGNRGRIRHIRIFHPVGFCSLYNKFQEVNKLYKIFTPFVKRTIFQGTFISQISIFIL